ncbi:UNVERIFIED_ORG: NAD(P)-dependent dehydrogenase (short-subunit alcohol dehydrogenase family) [Paraburkholderia sediminicola]|nr:NAD(P)-dependent dehydrogenase (short-subunit alcohol dehydrogenase family) [Paraburkholderia sediminicola]
MSLKVKQIVLLGGSSELGFATAKAAADADALIVVASSSQDELDLLP